MKNESVCEYLEWDSNFFSRRIARVNPSRLTENIIVQIGSWCRDNRIDCAYFLADASDPPTIRLAENNNFHFVDIRVTFERRADVSTIVRASAPQIRVSKDTDIPALRNIALKSHRDTRFYYDVHFPITLCDSLYGIWIEKSCRGWARNVFVGVDSEKAEPIGYITCHISTSALNEGQIGLVGVRESARGKGLGTLLVNHALTWFREQCVEKVSVVTQGRNVAAQRLYEKSGFLCRSVELWYHKWFQVSPS